MARLKKFIKYAVPALVTGLLLWGSAVITRVDLGTLLAGIPSGIALLRHMFPPSWASVPGLMGPAFETVQIAFVGTVMGASLALVVGLLAASNLSPHRIVREAARGLLAVERALPDLMTALFFVAIVGLGAFPGVMAVAISSIGMLGKLFADVLEEVDPKPLEALAAVGATKAQMIYYAVLPQALPSMIAHVLFRFDVNIRMSIFLGAVGAGGIGFNLIRTMGLMLYQEAMAAILVVLALVILCEKVSDALRRRILGQEVLR